VKRLAALLLGFAAAGAQAQHVEHAYLTLSGGPSSVQTTCLNTRYDCGLSAQGGRLLGGLFISPGVAVEWVCMDFGRGRETRFQDSQRVGLRMLGLGSAAQLELGGGLAFTVRGGLAGSRLQRTADMGGQQSRVVLDNVDLYAGLSAMFRVNRSLAIEASLDALGLSDDNRYRREGGVMATVGLSLRF
jgi:hypothetical protein